jgi:DNA-binding winged helix-turn-helix (wHTH) protein|tara:strand:- start:1876 stop:2124 length:249 start_codon:yes stop_codon:yes gene_type:complete
MEFLKDIQSNELILELQRRGYAISPDFYWCDDDVDANNEYLNVDLSGVDKNEIVLDALDSEQVIEIVNQRIYDALLDIQKNG